MNCEMRISFGLSVNCALIVQTYRREEGGEGGGARDGESLEILIRFRCRYGCDGSAYLSMQTISRSRSTTKYHELLGIGENSSVLAEPCNGELGGRASFGRI